MTASPASLAAAVATFHPTTPSGLTARSQAAQASGYADPEGDPHGLAAASSGAWLSLLQQALPEASEPPTELGVERGAAGDDAEAAERFSSLDQDQPDGRRPPAAAASEAQVAALATGAGGHAARSGLAGWLEQLAKAAEAGGPPAAPEPTEPVSATLAASRTYSEAPSRPAEQDAPLSAALGTRVLPYEAWSSPAERHEPAPATPAASRSRSEAPIGPAEPNAPVSAAIAAVPLPKLSLDAEPSPPAERSPGSAGSHPEPAAPASADPAGRAVRPRGEIAFQASLGARSDATAVSEADHADADPEAGSALSRRNLDRSDPKGEGSQGSSNAPAEASEPLANRGVASRVPASAPAAFAPSSGGALQHPGGWSSEASPRPAPVLPPAAAQLDPAERAQAHGPVRQMGFQLRSDGVGTAQVTLADRGGQVEVTVRAGDPAIVQALRGQISQLTAGLETQGYQVRFWSPALDSHSPSGGDASDGAYSADQELARQLEGRRQQPDPNPHRSKRAGWEDLLEESL